MLYTITSRIEVDAPVLIAALSGWVDAASAGTGTVSHIAGSGEKVAVFDPDALFDYRANRPILDIVDGIPKDLVWPEITVRYARRDHRDLLILSGSEPDFRWKEFATSVLDFALRFGVTELVCVGAVPAAVPHTRPTPVLTTASREELLQSGDRPPDGLLRVPSAAVSVIDVTLAGQGIPTVGFWAQIPHYITGPYYAGTIALVNKVAAHLGAEISVQPLEEEARAQRLQLDEIVSARPETAAHIERLESMAAAEEVVSGEELAGEIERFLRRGGTGDSRQFDDEGGSPGPLG
jgi:predicted ATP-grasp superfamily ATP-dependent carboligase